MSPKRILAGLGGRFRLARKMAELELRHRIAGETVWIDYGWLRLPYHSDGDMQEIYYHLDGGMWWEKERELLSPYVRAGWVAVDVGANLGFLTALFSSLVTSTGAVHSFEPSPVVFEKLRDVVTQNELTNVQIYNVGCGERESVLDLYAMPSSGNASLHRPACDKDVRAVHRVPIVKLDDYLLPRLSRLDLLKIDTEGFEDSVIAGAPAILERFRPVIYLELTSEYIAASQRAVSLLKAAHYKFLTEPVLEECHNGQNFIALPA